jgi:hypothetical protein
MLSEGLPRRWASRLGIKHATTAQQCLDFPVVRSDIAHVLRVSLRPYTYLKSYLSDHRNSITDSN